MSKGTPASSQIIWLEQRVKELEEENAMLHASVAEAVRQVEASDKLYREMCAKLRSGQRMDVEILEESVIDPMLEPGLAAPTPTCRFYKAVVMVAGVGQKVVTVYFEPERYTQNQVRELAMEEARALLRMENSP